MIEAARWQVSIAVDVELDEGHGAEDCLDMRVFLEKKGTNEGEEENTRYVVNQRKYSPGDGLAGG